MKILLVLLVSMVSFAQLNEQKNITNDKQAIVFYKDALKLNFDEEMIPGSMQICLYIANYRKLEYVEGYLSVKPETLNPIGIRNESVGQIKQKIRNHLIRNLEEMVAQNKQMSYPCFYCICWADICETSILNLSENKEISDLLNRLKKAK